MSGFEFEASRIATAFYAAKLLPANGNFPTPKLDTSDSRLDNPTCLTAYLFSTRNSTD
jgi:hypothetical protein